VGFTVWDLDRSVAFYRDLLGLQLDWERVYEEEYVRQAVGYPSLRLRCALLKLPGTKTRLELLQYESVPRQRVDMHTANPGNSHLCIAVRDLDKIYQRLQSVGVESVSSPVVSTAGHYKGSKLVYLHDPDGISLQLMELHREGNRTKTITQKRSRRPAPEVGLVR
jgi:catechol 2,3-dioxygenase-like lactoylglutathione lyase family enzyme